MDIPTDKQQLEALFGASTCFVMPSHREASAIAPFEYSALAWGLAIDWLVWHTLPDRWMLAGAAIIVASGIYLVRHESVHAEAEHP